MHYTNTEDNRNDPMDVEQADIIIYIIGGIIVLVAGTGGFGIRQFLLNRQNGNSLKGVLKYIDNNQKKTTKLLYKMDKKQDEDKIIRKKDLKLQVEREKFHYDEIQRSLSRIENKD